MPAPRYISAIRHGWLLPILLACVFPGCATWREKTKSDQLSSARQISLRGLEAESEGNWAEAERLYAEAVQACPHDDRSRCRYAEALWRRGDRSGAIANMEEAVRLSKQSPEQVVQLGRMHFEQADNQAAQHQTANAIEHNKELATAWTLKGDIARREGRVEDALADYLRARALPDCPLSTSFAIADIYAEQNRPQRALATLESLADRYPPSNMPPGILYRQGLAYRQMGRNDQAIACFAQSCSSPEAGSDQYFHLAEARQAVGDIANARLALQEGLRRNPDHEACRHLMTRLASVSGELSGVQRY